jgi:hypothetical protein
LSLPQLLQPLLVLEMLHVLYAQSDFLAGPFVPLQDCSWYQHVGRYARRVDVGALSDLNAQGEEEGFCDGDATLLLRVLSQAYLPYLTDMWDVAWDPLNAKQAECCSANLRMIYDIAQNAPSSPARAELSTAVCTFVARVCISFRGALLDPGASLALLPVLSFGEDEFAAAEDEAGSTGTASASASAPTAALPGLQKKKMFQIVIRTTTVPTSGPSALQMSRFREAREAIKPAAAFIESQLRCLTFALCNLCRFVGLAGQGADSVDPDPARELLTDVLRCGAVRMCCVNLLQLQRLELQSSEEDVLSEVYCTVGKLYGTGAGATNIPVNTSAKMFATFASSDMEAKVQRLNSMIEEVKKCKV